MRHCFQGSTVLQQGSKMNCEAQAKVSVESVIALFAAAGWSVDPNWPITASKEYDTAVGSKTAVTYARESRDGGIVLTADYQSEGRNALSTCWGRVPHDADDGEQLAMVARFVAEADKTVAATYAARLLRSCAPA